MLRNSYWHIVSAYLEINSAHAQISEKVKIAAVIVSFCPLTFFDKLYDLLICYDIREYLDIPYIIGHIITKARRVDLVGEGDIDLPPRENNDFIVFCVSNRTVDRYENNQSKSYPKNVISAHVQNFESILICWPKFTGKMRGHRLWRFLGMTSFWS